MATTFPPSAEEIASFSWGGRRARPRKNIEKKNVEKATYLKPPSSCNSKWSDTSIAINIECCADCTIAILDTTSQVNISECVNCRIIVGPCVGSVFLLECHGCVVTVAAKQLRLRDVTDCTLRTFAPSRESIVIETCKGLRFGAWDVAYPGLAAQFAATGWDIAANGWDKIYDFSPAACEPRNYALLPTSSARWAELTFSANGLTGGNVHETNGMWATVSGCECPCRAADGKRYEAAPVDCLGAAGYARKFATDGAGGYAAKLGGQAPASAATGTPAPKPVEDWGTGPAGTREQKATYYANIPKTEPPPSRRARAAMRTLAAVDPGMLLRVAGALVCACVGIWIAASVHGA